MNADALATLADYVSSEPWMDAALCAQADPELWYPPEGSSPQSAIAVCGRCPVRAECLAYALERREPFGVWGGLTERERRRLAGQAA